MDKLQEVHTPRHIIKFLNTNYKKTVLKGVREKQHITYRETLIQKPAYFSSETMATSRK